MTWLVGVLLGVFLLATVAVWVPIRIEFTIASEPVWKLELAVHWGRLLVRRFGLPGLPESGVAQRPASVPAQPPSRRTRVKRPRRRLTVEFALHLLKMVGRLIAQTELGQTTLTVRYGLDDPADTGLLFAALSPLQLLLLTKRAEVTWIPCFWEPCLELDGSGHVILVPARYLATLCRFIVSPQTWRLALKT